MVQARAPYEVSSTRKDEPSRETGRKERMKDRIISTESQDIEDMSPSRLSIG